MCFRQPEFSILFLKEKLELTDFYVRTKKLIKHAKPYHRLRPMQLP